MCGRAFQTSTQAEMGRIFSADVGATNQPARYNAAPRQQLVILRWNEEAQKRTLDPAEWGLLPHFETDPKKARRPINAKAETIDTLPTFRQAFAKRRCILPIDGFFEWKATKGGKQPYAIAMADRTAFGVAGLWEGWRQPDGQWLRTFCVATVPANSMMARIHDRMPAILHPIEYAAWLGEKDVPPSFAKSLLKPYPSEEMTMWPVTPEMNRWQFEDPSCILPIVVEGEG